MNKRETIKAIRALGFQVTCVDGEYRINVKGGTEATAYYTDDGADALGTAQLLVKRNSRKTEDGGLTVGELITLLQRQPADEIVQVSITGGSDHEMVVDVQTNENGVWIIALPEDA